MYIRGTELCPDLNTWIILKAGCEVTCIPGLRQAHTHSLHHSWQALWDLDFESVMTRLASLFLASALKLNQLKSAHCPRLQSSGEFDTCIVYIIYYDILLIIIPIGKRFFNFQFEKLFKSLMWAMQHWIWLTDLDWPADAIDKYGVAHDQSRVTPAQSADQTAGRYQWALAWLSCKYMDRKKSEVMSAVPCSWQID